MMHRSAVLIFALSLGASLSQASSPEYSRIARLSYLDGHVSFQNPSDLDWSAATINMALQPADRIYTGEDGRAEIEFDDGSVLLLAGKTDVEILSLREDFIQLRVLVGLVSLSVRSSVAYEINTPAAAFNTRSTGIYRIDVAENGDSDGIVRKGRLEAANNNFSRRLESGELVHVTAGDQGTHVLSRYASRDAWDEWTDRRNAEKVVYDSRRYVPDFVYIGVRDLDHYGRWVTVDAYGAAWIPRYVDVGWSPYTSGRWQYRPHWGWTWVSYEPWGWLPYHHGRWYHHVSFGWCWLPGASFGFHFWSPGLVRFYHGPSWVSWCPLGPGDYYNVNNYYFSNTHVYHLNNLRMMQRRSPDQLLNRNAPGAFHTVQTQIFANNSLGGRNRSSQLANVDKPWERGRLITDRLEVQPTARSYIPAPDRAFVRPSGSRERAVVVRTEPSPAAGDRGLFSRISNPQVRSAIPARSGAGSASIAVGSRGAISAGRPAATSARGAETGRAPVNSGERGAATGNRSAPPESRQYRSRTGSTDTQDRNPARSLGTPLRSQPPNAAPESANPRSRGIAPGSSSGSGRSYNPPRSSVPQPTPAPRAVPQSRPDVNRGQPEARPRSSDPPQSYSYAPRSSGRSYVSRPRVGSQGEAREAGSWRGYMPATSGRSSGGSPASGNYTPPAAGRSYDSRSGTSRSGAYVPAPSRQSVAPAASAPTSRGFSSRPAYGGGSIPSSRGSAPGGSSGRFSAPSPATRSAPQASSPARSSGTRGGRPQ